MKIEIYVGGGDTPFVTYGDLKEVKRIWEAIESRCSSNSIFARCIERNRNSDNAKAYREPAKKMIWAQKGVTHASGD